jgi:aspartyl-tRNA(Asn)/glutamyl-tRNA(Gln) amidotransferase subunit B
MAKVDGAMAYEAVIGLEVHAELLTQSKMFCGCAVVDSTQAAPNTMVCPVCLGLPGTLPVINARAVEFGLRVGLALNCAIPETNVFARKNYFYPDLPKGYQISQYELPLAVQGELSIEPALGVKRVRIRRVHLEEDTGKLFHADAGAGAPERSLVDFNRAGVPLLEIVTEPDLSSVEEVKVYATRLRTLLRYLGVNSGDMEKGVIRFEANVSVRPAGSQELRTRTEIKNLNSFRAMEKGVAYEIERQVKIWETGGQVAQETLGWNEAEGVTVPQRGKEHAHDYRYFPEPDLPPLVIDRAWVETLRAGLPELPDAKRARFETQYDLGRYDAGVLTEETAVADYFERTVASLPAGTGQPKSAANWITGELFRLMKETGQRLAEVKVTPAALAELEGLVARSAITLKTAKEVFEEMYNTGEPPEAIVVRRGLAQISDSEAIARAVEEVLAAHPDQLATYLSGKETLAQWFFGQVMRRLQGRGHPQLIRQALAERLAALQLRRP